MTVAAPPQDEICFCCLQCRLDYDHCGDCAEDHDDRGIDRGDFIGIFLQMREAISIPLGEIVLGRDFDSIHESFGFGGDGPFSHSHVHEIEEYVIYVPQMSVVMKIHKSGKSRGSSEQLWGGFIIPCYWYADDRFFEEIHHAMHVSAGHNVLDTIVIGGKFTFGTYTLGDGITREEMNSAIQWALTALAQSGWFWMPALLDRHLSADPEPGFERGQITGGIHDVRGDKLQDEEGVEGSDS